MARIVGIGLVAAFWAAVFLTSPLPWFVWLGVIAVALLFVYAVGLVITGDWDCWRELF